MKERFKIKPNFLVFKNQPQRLQEFEIDWSISFFNSQQYTDYQDTNETYTFVLADDSKQKALAFFHLFIDHKKGISPKQGSYGSIEISKNLSIVFTQNFVKSIIDFCQKLCLESIEIKHYPVCYDTKRSHIIEMTLFQSGFKVKTNYENLHLEVSDIPFENTIHSSEKRRLQKCVKAGFIFEEIQQPDTEQVYSYISDSRTTLGYKVTFQLDDLQAWFRLFSSSNIYQIFCVKHNQKIVAMSIIVNVLDGVLYNFCPADDLTYRRFSPAVMLTKGLYEYCQTNGIKLLDLGVSIDANGQFKPTLSKFKQNLGAVSSQKKTYVFTF